MIYKTTDYYIDIDRAIEYSLKQAEGKVDELWIEYDEIFGDIDLNPVEDIELTKDNSDG